MPRGIRRAVSLKAPRRSEARIGPVDRESRPADARAMSCESDKVVSPSSSCRNLLPSDLDGCVDGTYDVPLALASLPDLDPRAPVLPSVRLRCLEQDDALVRSHWLAILLDEEGEAEELTRLEGRHAWEWAVEGGRVEGGAE